MGRPPNASVSTEKLPVGLSPSSVTATIEQLYWVPGSRLVSLGLAAEIKTVALSPQVTLKPVITDHPVSAGVVKFVKVKTMSVPSPCALTVGAAVGFDSAFAPHYIRPQLPSFHSPACAKTGQRLDKMSTGATNNE